MNTGHVKVIKLLVLFLFWLSCGAGSANAGEFIELKSPILYYECIACTDSPNIYHPSYAALYKPVVDDWESYSDRLAVLALLKIPQYLKGQVALINKEEFYPPEVRLMLIGLLDYPIMVDRYSFVSIGNSYYKLDDGARAKLDIILGKL
jgi:hypothetical protein